MVRARLAAGSVLLIALLAAEPLRGEEAPEPIEVSTLARRFSDDAKANIILQISLPPALQGLADLAADRFSVHIFPAALPEEKGISPRWQARGVLFWRHGERAFLDVRRLPPLATSDSYVIAVRCVVGERVIAAGCTQAPLASRAGKTSVALVVDESLSMIRSDPHRRRVAAAQAFIEMATSGDRIDAVGAIAFNHQARVILPLTDASEAAKQIARCLREVKSEGQTNMDLALEAAAEMLAARERAAVVFLTDGRNEPRAYQGSHRLLAERRIPIFAIGLSNKADHALLNRMAAETDGAAFRAATGDELLALYQRIAAEIGCRVILLEENAFGTALERMVRVDRSVRNLAFTLAAPNAQGRFTVRRPDGILCDENTAPGMVFHCEGENRQAKAAAPFAGEWLFSFQGEKTAPLALTVSGESDFFLDFFPPQIEGRRATIAATLAQGELLPPQAEVHVALAGRDLLALYDDGQHGDGAAGDGVYANAIEISPELGEDLLLQAYAKGIAPHGDAFIRQARLAVHGLSRAPPPLPRPSPPPPPPPVLLTDGEVDFGVLLPGESSRRRQELHLSASRPQRLSLNPGALESAEGASLPPGALAVSLPPQPIAPGVFAIEVETKVPPQAHAGNYSGTIVLKAGETRAEIKIKLEIANAFLSIDRNLIDFGSLNPGQSSKREITLILEAPRPLPLSWRLSSGLASLAIIGRQPEQPLPPGEPLALNIRCRPPLDSQPGGKTAEIIFQCGPAEARLALKTVIASLPPEEIPEPVYTVSIPEPSPPEPEPLPSPPAEPTAPPLPEPAKGEEATTAAAALTTPMPELEKEVWRGIQPYLLWLLTLLLLLALLLAIVVRAAVRERMLRYGLLSLLAHTIIALLAIQYLILQRPERLWTEKPRLLANLVSIKESAGLTLTAAERDLLQRTRQLEEEERRFAAAADEKAEPRRSEAARSTEMAKTTVAPLAMIMPRPAPQEKMAKSDAQARAAEAQPSPPKPPMPLPTPSPAPKITAAEEARLARLAALAEEATRSAPPAANETLVSIALPAPEIPKALAEAKNSLLRRDEPTPRKEAMPSPPPPTSAAQNQPSMAESKKAMATSEEPARLGWSQSQANKMSTTIQPVMISDENTAAVSDARSVVGKLALAGAETLALPKQLAPSLASRAHASQPSAPLPPSSSPVAAAKATRPSGEDARIGAINLPNLTQPTSAPAAPRLVKEGAAQISPPQPRLTNWREQTLPLQLISSPAVKGKSPAERSPSPPPAAPAPPALAQDNVRHQPPPANTDGSDMRLPAIPLAVITPWRSSPTLLPQTSISSASSAKVKAQNLPATAAALALPMRIAASDTRQKPQEPPSPSLLALPPKPRHTASISRYDDTDRFPNAEQMFTSGKASAAAPQVRHFAIDAGSSETQPHYAAESEPSRPLMRLASTIERTWEGEPEKTKALLAPSDGKRISPVISQRTENIRRFDFSAAAIAGAAASDKQTHTVRPLPAAPHLAQAATERLRQPLPPRTPTMPPPQALPPGQSRAAGAVAASGVNIIIGEVKFDSDWNSSPNAIANLVDAYRRRIATGVRVEKRVVNLAVKEIAECQMLFMTANEPFVLRESEAQALRTYLAAGGCLWVNDSSHEDDERFDEAFRREIKRVIAAPLERLPADHPILTAVYDFSRGYLGYRVPPGDKYRVDYLEGISWNGRLCVLYTRNDYADGMALDPHLQALRPSLTDLAPEEMQEGAIRFGINAVHYFLGGAAVSEETTEDMARLYPRAASIWQGDESALSLWQDYSQLKPEDLAWQVENWSNPATATLAPNADYGQVLRIDMQTGPKDKVAVKYDIPAKDGRRLDLSGVRSIVVDVMNGHRGGFGMSLVITTISAGEKWRDFETKAVFLKPGWNKNIRFMLQGAKCKCRETGWRDYDTEIASPQACGKISFFFYNQGRIAAPVLVGKIRLEK